MTVLYRDCNGTIQQIEANSIVRYGLELQCVDRFGRVRVIGIPRVINIIFN